MSENHDITLEPVFNPYGAAPLVTTTFGCLAATYDRQPTLYSEDLETEGYLFTKLSEQMAEIVSPGLSLFWLEPELGQEVEKEEAEEAKGEKWTAEAECKLFGAPLVSIELVNLEDDFVGEWWLEVLRGETRKELHEALCEKMGDETEHIACRTAAASILSKLAWSTVKLPPEVIRYMLDCRVAMNSLEFRMMRADSQLVHYVAKRRKQLENL